MRLERVLIGKTKYKTERSPVCQEQQHMWPKSVGTMTVKWPMGSNEDAELEKVIRTLRSLVPLC